MDVFCIAVYRSDTLYIFRLVLFLTLQEKSSQKRQMLREKYTMDAKVILEWASFNIKNTN